CGRQVSLRGPGRQGCGLPTPYTALVQSPRLGLIQGTRAVATSAMPFQPNSVAAGSPSSVPAAEREELLSPAPKGAFSTDRDRLLHSRLLLTESTARESLSACLGTAIS